jgi:hypothetical protein
VDPRATRTKEEALRSARELLAQLKARPARFAQWQRERCEIAFCDGVHTFEEGRGPPALERALRKIEVGALAHAPVETPFGIVLVRREDPLAPHILQAKAGANGSNAASSQAASRRSARVRARAKHGATVAVQSPDAARKAPERFADNLRRFERYAFGKMRLSRPERTEVTSILDAFAHAVLEGGDRDLQADAQRADERLAQLLGPSKHEELTRHRAAFFSEQAP